MIGVLLGIFLDVLMFPFLIAALVLRAFGVRLGLGQ